MHEYNETQYPNHGLKGRIGQTELAVSGLSYSLKLTSQHQRTFEQSEVLNHHVFANRQNHLNSWKKEFFFEGSPKTDFREEVLAILTERIQFINGNLEKNFYRESSTKLTEVLLKMQRIRELVRKLEIMSEDNYLQITQSIQKITEMVQKQLGEKSIQESHYRQRKITETYNFKNQRIHWHDKNFLNSINKHQDPNIINFKKANPCVISFQNPELINSYMREDDQNNTQYEKMPVNLDINLNWRSETEKVVLDTFTIKNEKALETGKQTIKKLDLNISIQNADENENCTQNNRKLESNLKNKGRQNETKNESQIYEKISEYKKKLTKIETDQIDEENEFEINSKIDFKNIEKSNYPNETFILLNNLVVENSTQERLIIFPNVKAEKKTKKEQIINCSNPQNERELHSELISKVGKNQSDLIKHSRTINKVSGKLEISESKYEFKNYPKKNNLTNANDKKSTQETENKIIGDKTDEFLDLDLMQLQDQKDIESIGSYIIKNKNSQKRFLFKNYQNPSTAIKNSPVFIPSNNHRYGIKRANSNICPKSNPLFIDPFHNKNGQQILETKEKNSTLRINKNTELPKIRKPTTLTNLNRLNYVPFEAQPIQRQRIAIPPLDKSLLGSILNFNFFILRKLKKTQKQFQSNLTQVYLKNKKIVLSREYFQKKIQKLLVVSLNKLKYVQKRKNRIISEQLFALVKSYSRLKKEVIWILKLEQNKRFLKLHSFIESKTISSGRYNLSLLSIRQKNNQTELKRQLSKTEGNNFYEELTLESSGVLLKKLESEYDTEIQKNRR